LKLSGITKEILEKFKIPQAKINQYQWNLEKSQEE
jgi:hypothetical protein